MIALDKLASMAGSALMEIILSPVTAVAPDMRDCSVKQVRSHLILKTLQSVNDRTNENHSC